MQPVFIKKTYVYLGVAIALVLIIIVYLLLTVFFSGGFYTPPKDVEQSKEYKDSIKVVNEKEAPSLEKSSKVGDLLLKLPYQGQNFAMDFDFQNNNYIVTINRTSQQAGNAEFDQFLRDNDIESRDWIKHLTIIYK